MQAEARRTEANAQMGLLPEIEYCHDKVTNHERLRDIL